MIVGVLKEPISGEKRVAATPESVKQLITSGLKVTVQKGAGVAAGYADDDYKSAGATVAPSVDVAKLDVLTHVRPLAPATIKKLKKGTITVGLGSPASETAAVIALRDQGVTSFALELVPRISRAQSMDALTSQALGCGIPLCVRSRHAFATVLPLIYDRCRHGSARNSVGFGCRCGRPASHRHREAPRSQSQRLRCSVSLSR